MAVFVNSVGNAAQSVASGLNSGPGRDSGAPRQAHRFAQSETHALYTAGGFEGQRAMHAARLPPGHPEGTGGEGPGGVGEGPGDGPAPVVDPMSPNLMLE